MSLRDILLTISDLASNVAITTGSGSALPASCGLLLVGLVPLLGHLLLPVRLLSELIDTVLDDGECLAHLVILHVLLIVKLVSKLKKVIDLSLFSLFELSLGLGPGGLLRTLLGSFLAGDRGRLAAGLSLLALGLSLEVGSSESLGLGLHGRGSLHSSLIVVHWRLLCHHLFVLILNVHMLETLYLLSLPSSLVPEHLIFLLLGGHLAVLVLPFQILLLFKLFQELLVANKDAVRV